MKMTYRELGSRRELIDTAKQIFTKTGFIELGKEPEDIITADSGLYFSYTFFPGHSKYNPDYRLYYRRSILFKLTGPQELSLDTIAEAAYSIETAVAKGASIHFAVALDDRSSDELDVEVITF